MANPEIQLYNFYRRYRWRAEDFLGWQKGMVDHSRGMFEGLFSGGVLEGFEISPDTGLNIEVSAGLASGPTGFLHVVEEVTSLELEAATGSPRRDLVVVRPNLVDNEFITKPTNPSETVPLRTAQESSVLVLQGVEANSPSYPSVEANDVILCGVRVEPGQTGFTVTDFDFEVRDVLGKNSKFQQNQAKYDERCLVTRETNQSIRVKPSQTQIGQNPKNFLFVNKGTPSRFPLNMAGNFNFADTFVNFNDGTITGGDEQSANFTPQIPTSGNWIVATLSLQGDDTLNVSYGAEGTREQCFEAISNARTSGAGSVNLPSQMMRLAFVIIGSNDGVSVTEIDTIDGRSTFYFGGPDNQQSYPNVFLSALGAGNETTLQDAVNALPAQGGVLLVMDDIIVPGAVTIPANTKVIGRGKGASLTFTGATGMVTEDNVTIQDLIIACEGPTKCIVVAGDYNNIEKCLFSLPANEVDAVGITVEGDGTHIGENVFEGVVSPGIASGIVYEAGSSENSDEFNVFTP